MAAKFMFNIWLNDRLVGDCPANKQAAKAWIKQNLFSTHMGSWVRQGDGWEYQTTIGQYYRFSKTRV